MRTARRTAMAAWVALALWGCSGGSTAPNSDPGTVDAGTGVGDVNLAPGDVNQAPGDVGQAPGDVGQTPGDVEPDPVALAPFVYATTCSLPSEPPSSASVELVEAFPNLSVSYPLLLTHANDGSGRLFVVERFGKIRVFQNDPQVASATTYLDLSNTITTVSEGGLLGLAFHPNYGANGHLFVNYTVMVSGTMHTIVSRFTVSASDPLQANPSSEVILLDIIQPYSNHDGGMIAFGPDGHLYVGMGDGGAAGDPLGHGQDTQTLLGAMLRIDVDNPSGGMNYGIPPDNPFVQGGGRAEIYAWGLRNPWRFSFDTLTGALWAGDVGQNAWEEISVIGLGENHGWNTMEGFGCYPPQVTNCDQDGLTLPIMQYPNAGKGSVTGGYVYRGSKVPSLYGTYVFADYEQYSLYLLATDQSPPDAPAMTTPGRVAGFGQDAEGEVYVLSLLDGVIYRFQEATTGAPVAPSEPFPQTLTDTGCFTDLTTMEPAPGVLPYDLNLPFWSDGAEKSRWMVLPQGGQLTFDATGEWSVPEGTLFIKHFELAQAGDDPASPTRLETRFLIHESSGVRGYVYRWNDAGTEATLLQSGDTREVTVAEEDGAMAFSWQFPARHQCRSCHTTEAGGVLGIETAQLNRQTDLHGLVDNQLDIWATWGLFTSGTSPSETATLHAHPRPDDTASTTDARARSWLHVNCASCHMGQASGGTMDLRLTTALGDTGTCEVVPDKGDLGVTGARLLNPGSPSSSMLHRRLVAEPPYRMPPLATSRHDAVGAGLIASWIANLAACP